MNTPVSLPRSGRLRRIEFRWRQIAFVTLTGCAVTAGCARAPWSSQVARDISPAREARGVEAARNFEAFRNHAQHQAACARWQEGDWKNCEQTLQAVLQRSPDFHEARLTLADLYAATERPELAERELRIAIARRPDDPQVHYALSLLLESMGRPDESRAHLDQAVALEPENDLYSASHDTLLATTRPSSPRTRQPAASLVAQTGNTLPESSAAATPKITRAAHLEPVAPSASVETRSHQSTVAPITSVTDREDSAESTQPQTTADVSAPRSQTSSAIPAVIAAPDPPPESSDAAPVPHFRLESP